jgi:hypothetical protein
MRWLLAATLCALLAAPAAAEPILNEVLYDPEGPDDGAEFVELWNPADAPVSLSGLTIEAADGATPGSWRSIWTGGPADSIPPRAPFLVAGSALTGSMQNGPDAVRLLRGGAVLDLLGYGALADPDMYRGSPAPDAPPGQSLARVVDGADTGVNAADWAAEPAPSPGRANHPEVGLAFLEPAISLSPPVPWPGETLTAVVRVRSIGRRGLSLGEWTVAVGGEDASGPPAATVPGPPLAPGDTATVPLALAAPPARGPFSLRAAVRAAAGEAAFADTARIAARAGAGEVLVSEFAFHGPAGEWVEIECLEPVADLALLSLSDRAGRAVRLDRGADPRPAQAGSRLVLAESPAAVLGRYALPESVVLGLAGGWPSLNDTDGPDGFADVVRLYGPDGSISDAVPYASSYADRDGSVERLAEDLPSGARETWAETIDPSGGTPGRPNSLRAAHGAAPVRGALLEAPIRAVLRSGSETRRPALLRLTAQARGRRLRIEIRDLRGRPLRVLASGQRFPGEAALLWDGRDGRGAPVPPGIYTVRAEAEAEGARPARATTLALWVAEEGRR